ncbi:MAG: HIT domain-containing protein [Candidatus Saccharimonadales bacterium]|jgi:diadenosine tetraphosphate (Ap4A) HIT family hydrolase|nr:HIT domain-containing protein [Candidatus Saccharibacteria bacterium]
MADYVNIENARHDDQLSVMKGIAEDGVCPFDEEYIAKYHKQPVLRQGTYWTLTLNQWPYEHTRVHLLAIARKHVESIDELPAVAGEELFEHVRWAIAEYKIDFGGLAMRFGDVRHNGASVNHLHAHIIVPDKNKPADAKVKFKIS